MSLEIPVETREALDRWAELMKEKLKKGDLVIVDWFDAADEKQVVTVKPEKVATPVHTVGLFHDLISQHLIIVNHVFSEKWKDLTYIPVGMVHRVEVRSDERKYRLLGERTWRGNAHTRKVLIGKRTRAIHSARVKAVLGGE